jgi:polysaccharide biosynthesis transport protein
VYNLIDPEIQAKLLSEQAGALANQQVETQTQLNETRLLYEDLRKQLTNQTTESAAASALDSSPRYQRLLDQLSAIDSKLAQDSALYLDSSLEIQVLQEQRQNLLPLLQQEGASVERGVVSKIQELENRSQALAKSIAELNQKIKQLSVITRQYTDIQRELQIATDNLNQFLAKREGLRIDAAQRQIPWQLLTPPGEPQPSSSDWKRSLILGTILGALLGTGVALVVDKLGNVIHTSKEVKDITKLPLLGVIPFNPYLEKIESRDDTPSWLQSAINVRFMVDRSSQKQAAVPFLEAFRSLYANIRMSSPDAPVRSLIVSSAAPNNGKTTVAIHLGQAAAGMGQRVLVVDADLRRPNLHNYLGIADTDGLTEVVSADLDLMDAVRQVSWESNLFILTAGSIPPDPSRILSSQSMKTLVSKSCEMFDLVIFDTPPLLGLADTYLLSDYTDGILLVVRLNQLNRSLLEQTLEDLTVAAAPMLGAVANASQEPTVNSYSYYNPHTDDEPKQSRGIISKFRERIGY